MTELLLFLILINISYIGFIIYYGLRRIKEELVDILKALRLANHCKGRLGK